MNDVAAQSTNARHCDVCESQTIVTYRCKDCKQNICDVCKKIHSKISVTKNHVTVDFVDVIQEEEISEDGNHGYHNPQTNDAPVDLCPVHTSKPIEIYCVECKTCVCLQCYVDASLSQGVHNGHTILILDRKVTQTKLRDDLKGLNINLQAQIYRLQEFSDDLTSKLSEIDICSEEACNKVDQQIQLIYNLVHSRAEQIKTQIIKIRHEERQKLEIMMKEMEISITELKSNIKESLMTLEGESVVKIVERNERHRNNEIKVKQKDLVVPDLQFPCFLPGNDVKDEVEKLVGECTKFQQPNFTLEFNINTIYSKNVEQQLAYFNLGELIWGVAVHCKDGKTLAVFLGLNEENNKTSEKRKVKVECSFTVLNKLAGKSRSRHNFVYELEAGDHGYGDGSLIELKELNNPENGFVDKDGNFSIRIEIKKTER